MLTRAALGLACVSLLMAQAPVKPLKPRDIPKLEIEPKLLQVETPRHEADFQVTNRKIVLTVTFNGPVDPASVVPGQSLRMAFSKAPQAAGTLTWTSNRQFVWTSQADFMDLCDFQRYKDCSFKITLTDAIRTKGGTRLDGDKNGTAGGDFVKVLILVG